MKAVNLSSLWRDAFVKVPLVWYAAYTAAVLLMALTPDLSWAQTTGNSFDLPIVTTFGCALVKWMSGPLAIVVFLLVTIATLVIGIFAKMDWTKILTVIIIFGIIQGLVAGSFRLGITNGSNICPGFNL